MRSLISDSRCICASTTAGKVEGDGYEPLNADPTVRRTFTLKDGKIEGALLTATKVYAGGKPRATRSRIPQ